MTRAITVDKTNKEQLHDGAHKYLCRNGKLYAYEFIEIKDFQQSSSMKRD